MRYAALATDYDGTLAWDGVVVPETVEALERFRRSGRKLILVTGRELEDLRFVFSRLDLFDRVVAENGAVIYRPSTRETKKLGARPPFSFTNALRERGVRPLALGEVITATSIAHERAVREVIQDARLDLDLILNKGSLMILPAGVDKMTGLLPVLRELNVAAEDTVGVGDAENDRAFLQCCGYSVAVANALPSVKAMATLTTSGDHGAGVVELIGMILGDGLPGARFRQEHISPDSPSVPSNIRSR